MECIYIASRRGWKGPRRRSYAPYILPQLTERTHNPLGTPDSHEPKPRLGKDEVEQLELEFSKTPKPNSYVKKELSERMGVEVSRINVGRRRTALDPITCVYVDEDDPRLTCAELVSKSSRQGEADARNFDV